MTYSCKNCQNRQVGCHSMCEKYQTEKGKHEQEKAAKDKQKAEEHDISRYTFERVMKAVFSRERRRWK